MGLTGQQGWWLWAQDMDDPHSYSVTVQVKNRNTFAEIALFDVWVLDEEFHSTTAGITQIVSDSGVENFSPESKPLEYRKNVTSVTFQVYVINALAAGRWMLHFWS